MLVSRLNATKYPWSNPDAWITAPGVDPVFLGRLAAYARYKGRRINLTSAGGKRDSATQLRLYKLSNGNGTAARPGTSWHEYGLAIDTADAWLKALCNGATATQSELLKFGLFKPMARGNNLGVVEDWHIQPIETKGIPAADRPKWCPIAVDIEVDTFQSVFGLTVDDKYGPKSMEKAQLIYFGRTF